MSASTTLKLNPDKTVGYHLVAGIIGRLATLLFRPTVTGEENIPLTGPVLITPIHRSNLDFAFTLFMSPRKVFFMAKDSIFRVPVLGRLLLNLGAFPVTRGTADRESMKLAEEVLRLGHALVLFPEGTRQEGRVVGQLRDGAMFVAARTGATVIPVGVGSRDRTRIAGVRVPWPARLRIVVGAPIVAPSAQGRISRSIITAKSEELRQALQQVYLESLDA